MSGVKNMDEDSQIPPPSLISRRGVICRFLFLWEGLSAGSSRRSFSDSRHLSLLRYAHYEASAMVERMGGWADGRMEFFLEKAGLLDGKR